MNLKNHNKQEVIKEIEKGQRSLEQIRGTVHIQMEAINNLVGLRNDFVESTLKIENSLREMERAIKIGQESISEKEINKIIKSKKSLNKILDETYDEIEDTNKKINVILETQPELLQAYVTSIKAFGELSTVLRHCTE